MKRGIVPDEELPMNMEVLMGYTTVAMGECLERFSNLNDKYEGLDLKVGYHLCGDLSYTKDIPDEVPCQ